LLSQLPHDDDYERTKIPTMTCTSLCDASLFAFIVVVCLWVASSLSESRGSESEGVRGLKGGLISGGWTCVCHEVIGETGGGMNIFVIRRF
jgi:hypothetical protein